MNGTEPTYFDVEQSTVRQIRFHHSACSDKVLRKVDDCQPGPFTQALNAAIIGVVSVQASVVLEHLAATGWFAEHGEVALTAGLTFCLEKDDRAAQAFVRVVRQRTGYSDEDLPSPDRWVGEAVDEKRGRVDLAGHVEIDGILAPVVLVEAKVSAFFAPRQISSYVISQKAALDYAGLRCGALAVLVPSIRVRAAREEVAADLESSGFTTRDGALLVDGLPAVTVAVISWDEALEAMLADADPAICDLRQLRGACRALQGADVRAFTELDLAGQWRNRRDDLALVINRVTRAASAELSLQPLPWQPNPYDGFEGGFRYVALAGLPNLAVGIRQDGASPPLWVRWHKRTPSFGLVEPRLLEAGHSTQKHLGHLWVPLKFQPDSGSATRQIEDLVSQVVQLFKIATASTEHL